MISLDKKYRTRDGREVELYFIYPEYVQTDSHVVGAVKVDEHWFPRRWTLNGEYTLNNPNNPRDLIEVTPWDDFKVDDPVMVRDYDDETWFRRYFSGINERGKPMTWGDGRTSWSRRPNDRLDWDECRRPTPEELIATQTGATK